MHTYTNKYINKYSERQIPSLSCVCCLKLLDAWVVCFSFDVWSGFDVLNLEEAVAEGST